MADLSVFLMISLEIPIQSINNNLLAFNQIDSNYIYLKMYSTVKVYIVYKCEGEGEGAGFVCVWLNSKCDNIIYARIYDPNTIVDSIGRHELLLFFVIVSDRYFIKIGSIFFEWNLFSSILIELYSLGDFSTLILIISSWPLSRLLIKL